MELKLGLYQHYRGNFYQDIGLCRHTETLEALVVYQSLLWRLWFVGPAFDDVS